ncbi:flagellar hook-associated protein FlgL [Alteribacillus sp. JSM 102045]|uniref:flagellar hook-associated protein FlgL n=1 Tax=Alteribacillus sp. JSM 102045 TaxID=1562101 RepID=UPI0035C1D285
MRVTQSMLAQNSLRHMSQSYNHLGTLQDQLSTGKKITRASQDPVVAMSGIRYRTQSNEVAQFQRNLGEAYNWMEASDSALDKSTQALQRIRELATQAANDTYEEGQRSNMAEEVTQLFEHLVSMANTQSNGKYIFNGTNTTEQPVTLNDEGKIDEVLSNTGDVEIELMKGVKIPVNSEAGKVFNSKFFEDIKKLIEDLDDPDIEGEDLTGSIETIDKHIDIMVNERAEMGARLNRIEMMDERLGKQEVIAERILSDNEDADMVKVMIDLMSQENVHRAALGAGARIIQPTLMDFLR